MLVLLTDPFPADQQWTIETLQQLDYTVMRGQTYNECMELLTTHTFHVVVLEYALMVPDDGLAFCSYLRAQSPIPILFWTRYRFGSCLTAAINAGADTYLVKPMPPREFQLRCAALLRRIYQVTHPILTRTPDRRVPPNQGHDSSPGGTLRHQPDSR